MVQFSVHWAFALNGHLQGNDGVANSRHALVVSIDESSSCTKASGHVRMILRWISLSSHCCYACKAAACARALVSQWWEHQIQLQDLLGKNANMSSTKIVRAAKAGDCSQYAKVLPAAHLQQWFRKLDAAPTTSILLASPCTQCHARRRPFHTGSA